MTKPDHVTSSDAADPDTAGHFRRDGQGDARAAVALGRAAHARGETLQNTPDAFMDGIARKLGIADVKVER